MKYFLHDTNAFEDEKISLLYMNFGYEGLGLFYTILEKLAKQEKPVNTDVLKMQLNIGKKLNKCWGYMEQIELISSTNKETFNEQLLNFSEKYQIRKEKTRNKVKEWRDNQVVKNNVTGYEIICNDDKVKESKVNESKGEEIISPKEKSWREDFEVYKSELREFYKTIRKDNEWILNQQRFNPNVNILLTLEKAVVNYWATEAGWKNKKRSKSKTIDWKSTLTNALSNPSNKVYLAKDTNGGNTDAIMHRNSKGEVLHRTEWIEDGIRYYGSRQGRKYQVPMDMSPRPSEQFSLSSRIENGKEVFNWIIQ